MHGIFPTHRVSAGIYTALLISVVYLAYLWSPQYDRIAAQLRIVAISLDERATTLAEIRLLCVIVVVVVAGDVAVVVVLLFAAVVVALADVAAVVAMAD